MFFCCKYFYVAVGCVKCYLVESNWSVYSEKTRENSPAGVCQWVVVSRPTLTCSQKNKHHEDKLSVCKGALYAQSCCVVKSVLGSLSLVSQELS